MAPVNPNPVQKAREIIIDAYRIQIEALDDLSNQLQTQIARDPKTSFQKLQEIEKQRYQLIRNMKDVLWRLQNPEPSEAPEEEEEKNPLKALWKSQKFQDGLMIGLSVFFPPAFAFKELNLQDRIELPEFLYRAMDSFHASMERSAERRKQREVELKDAIHNPASLEDFKGGNLFVLDEEGANNLIAELMSHSGKSKVRNVKVEIDDDALKISGEYDTWVGWVDFSAKVRFELKNGETSGKIYKVEASGIDLGSILEGDILKSFRQFGIKPPEDAKIDDLSWIQIPGMKSIEIDNGRIIIEREPSPIGPS